MAIVASASLHVVIDSAPPLCSAIIESATEPHAILDRHLRETTFDAGETRHSLLKWISGDRAYYSRTSTPLLRGRPVTRFLLAIPVLAAALAATPSKAQTYDPSLPVCIHIYGIELGDRIDCIYATIAQCQAAAVGLPATCELNPYYASARAAPVRRKRH
jgi:hypothetical protein